MWEIVHVREPCTRSSVSRDCHVAGVGHGVVVRVWSLSYLVKALHQIPPRASPPVDLRPAFPRRRSHVPYGVPKVVADTKGCARCTHRSAYPSDHPPKKRRILCPSRRNSSLRVGWSGILPLVGIQRGAFSRTLFSASPLASVCVDASAPNLPIFAGER